MLCDRLVHITRYFAVLIGLLVLAPNRCFPQLPPANHLARPSKSKSSKEYRNCLNKEGGLSDEAGKLSVAEARRNLQAALERMNRDGSDLKTLEPIKQVRVLPQMFEFFDSGVTADGDRYATMRYFRFKDLDYSCINKHLFKGYAVMVGIGDSMETDERRQFVFGYRGSDYYPADADYDNAQLLVNAVNRLILEVRNGNPAEAADLANFKSKAAEWRALSIKPPFPEEARKYRVLAENALEEKNFDSALKNFESALAIFPLWPEGYFNAAMMSAEVGDYTDALRHMQRYLELTPDAPDARAARDKMFIWEAKANDIEGGLTHGDDAEADTSEAKKPVGRGKHP